MVLYHEIVKENVLMLLSNYLHREFRLFYVWLMNGICKVYQLLKVSKHHINN